MITETPSITNLKCEDGRWYWSVTDAFDGTTTDMRTNNDGEGTWQWLASNSWDSNGTIYEWKQTTGTCQFSLAGKSKSAARSYIRRQFTY